MIIARLKFSKLKIFLGNITKNDVEEARDGNFYFIFKKFSSKILSYIFIHFNFYKKKQLNLPSSDD